jgi:hypothetical protein
MLHECHVFAPQIRLDIAFVNAPGGERNPTSAEINLTVALIREETLDSAPEPRGAAAKENGRGDARP